MMFPPCNTVITLEKAQECAFSDVPAGDAGICERQLRLESA